MATDYPLKAIRTYQAVTFERKSVTFFTLHQLPGKPIIKLKYLKDMNAIEIKSDKDHVLVPVTNVSAMYLWTDVDNETVEHKVTESKKKFKIKASEIKRPK